MDKARLKRWAKRAAIVLAGFILMVGLGLGMLLFWLGTESANRQIFNLASRLLEKQGLYLKAEGVAGRLPFWLELKGLSLADGQGVWLEVPELGLELSPLSLFAMEVEVDSLAVRGARLHRLPELPPGGEKEPGQGGPINIPIDIFVREALIEDAQAESGLLAALLPERAEALGGMGPISLNLRAMLGIKKGGLLEPGRLNADAAAAATLADGSGVRLRLLAGSHAGMADKLLLELLAWEDQGGLLAALSGLEVIPAYSLHIFSDSSLDNLSLDLVLDSGRMVDEGEEDPARRAAVSLATGRPGTGDEALFSPPPIMLADRLARLSGSVGLTPLGDGSGQDRRDKFLSPNWRADLALLAEPGPLLAQEGGPYDFLPGEILELIDDGLNLNAQVKSDVRDDLVVLDIERLRLDNEMLMAGLDKAVLGLALSDDDRQGATDAVSDGFDFLNFSGDILAEIKQEAFFEILGVTSQEEEGDVPLFGPANLLLHSNLSIKDRPQGSDGAALPEISFSVNGPLRVASRHPLFRGAGQPDLAAELEVAGHFAEALDIHTLKLSGLGLALDGGASMTLSPLLVNLDAQLSGERDGGWMTILHALSDSIPPMTMQGRLQAQLNLAPGEEARALQARLEMAAAEFGWPSEDLGRVFGPYVSVQGDFYGPLASPYQVDLHGVFTGFEPVAAGAFDPDAPIEELQGGRARGNLELSLAGVAPTVFMPRWSQAEQTRLMTLNGRLDLALGDVGLFLPDQDDFSGPVRGTASVMGLVGGDDTVLDLQASVENLFPQGLVSPVGALTFQADAGGDLTLRDGLIITGRAALDAETDKVRPGQVRMDWQVAQPEGRPLTVTLDNITSAWGGINLEGRALVALPEGDPVITSYLYAHLESWNPVNEAFERLELDLPHISGSPLDLALSMEPDASGQSAAVLFDLPFFSMPITDEGGGRILYTPDGEPELGVPGYLIINGMQGRVDVEDLWNRQRISAHLLTEQGSADVETWQSFAIYVDMAENRGRINLAMREDGEALTQVQAVEEESSGFSSGQVDRSLQESANADLEAEPESAPAVAETPAEQPGGPRENWRERRLRESRAAAGLGENEIASMSGVFRLDPFMMRINRAALYAPELRTGLYLENPAFIRVAEDDIRVRNLNVAVLPGGYVRADAYFSDESSQARAEISEFPLALIRRFANVPLPDGELSLTTNLTSFGRSFSGQAQVEANLRPVQSWLVRQRGEDTGKLQFRMQGALDDSSPKFGLPTRAGGTRLSASGTLAVLGERPEGDRDLTLDIDIPMMVGRRGVLIPDIRSPMAARLDWKGELDRIWAFLPIADRSLSGLVDMDLSLGGTLLEITHSGSAYLAGGRYEDDVLGFMLDDIELELRADDRETSLLLAGTDGEEGKLALEAHLIDGGRVYTGLGRGNTFEQPRLVARGQVNHLAPLHRDDVFVRFSGIIDAEGPLLSPLVEGQVIVEQGNYNILSSFGGGVTTLPVEEKADRSDQRRRTVSPLLDIKVEAPSRFYVRGLGLESEWKASATIKGPATDPRFAATISPVRGYFDLLSRPFALTEGTIELWGGDGFDSNLDLLLTYSSASLTARVNVGGSLNRPSMTLSSVPPLPQDQIMSEVLFGKDITQLSAIEALQVANGLRQLVAFGQGGFDLIGDMRDFLGIDTLRLGSSSSGGQASTISGSPGADAFGVSGGTNEQDTGATPTIEAGKYLNDAIYVGVEQGTTENSTRMRVEIELRPNLTLQGNSGTQSSQVGLGWKRDY